MWPRACEDLTVLEQRTRFARKTWYRAMIALLYTVTAVGALVMWNMDRVFEGVLFMTLALHLFVLFHIAEQNAINVELLRRLRAHEGQAGHGEGTAQGS